MCPCRPAYALIAQDFGKLGHILDTVTPGAVFAASPAYERALLAVLPEQTPVVLATGALQGRASEPLSGLLATAPGPSLAAAHAAIGPDTIAKFLFTSGSTKQPES